MEEDALQVEILTPSKRSFQGAVRWLQVPTSEGLMEILPGHAELVTVLDIGCVRLNFDNGIHWSVAIHGGVMEVGPDRALILASEAERPEEIDLHEARKRLEEVHEEIGTRTLSRKHRLIQDRLRAEARIGAFRSRARDDNGENGSGRSG